MDRGALLATGCGAAELDMTEHAACSLSHSLIISLSHSFSTNSNNYQVAALCLGDSQGLGIKWLI